VKNGKPFFSSLRATTAARELSNDDEVDVRWLKKALGKTGRKHAEELCTKGYVAAREGKLDAAQKLYEEAIDADPTLAVASFNAGQTALERYNRDSASLDDAGRRARLEEAARHLDACLDLDPHHAPSWRALARVHERLNRPDAAYAAWARVEAAIGAPPTPTAAMGDAVPPEASDIAAARAEARKERARLKSAADLATAVARVKTLVAALDHPDAAPANGADGADAAADSAAQAAQAIDALLAASAAAVADGVAVPAGVRTIAGALARRTGDAVRARALLDEAIVADAKDLEAHKNLATVCLQQGDLATALRASLAAYRLDPVDAGLVCNLGVCHLTAAQAGVAGGTVAQAAEYIELAAQMAPKDAIVQRAVKALREAQKS